MESGYQKSNQLISAYVRTVLVLEGSSLPDPALPLLTNGMPALFCRFGKDKTGNEHIIRLTLFGKSIPADCWAMDENTTIIAYFFKPFASAAIFGVPAKKLAANGFNLCDWSPHKYNALKTQLIYSGSTSRKTEVLDNLLILQLKENNRECEIIRYATDQIMCNPDTEILSLLLEKLRLSERTFQRLFRKYVGVTPTQYRRICQFQTSFAQLRANRFEKISDVAFENGFSDQSHFIRSFKEYTRTTPNDYLRKGLTDKNK